MLQVLCMGVALNLKLPLTGARSVTWLHQDLLFLLSHNESRSGHILRLFVCKRIVYKEEKAGNEKSNYRQDHEDNVRYEISISDDGCGLSLTLFGG